MSDLEIPCKLHRYCFSLLQDSAWREQTDTEKPLDSQEEPGVAGAQTQKAGIGTATAQRQGEGYVLGLGHWG